MSRFWALLLATRRLRKQWHCLWYNHKQFMAEDYLWMCLASWQATNDIKYCPELPQTQNIQIFSDFVKSPINKINPRQFSGAFNLKVFWNFNYPGTVFKIRDFKHFTFFRHFTTFCSRSWQSWCIVSPMSAHSTRWGKSIEGFGYMNFLTLLLILDLDNTFPIIQK